MLLNMYTLISFQMKVDQIARMQLGVAPIPFHVRVIWNGGQPLRTLTYKTDIEGATEHHITVVSPCDFTGEIIIPES